MLLLLLLLLIVDLVDYVFIIARYKKVHRHMYLISRCYSNISVDIDDIVSETAHIGMDNRRKALRDSTVDAELDEVPSHDPSVDLASCILERVTIDVLAGIISKLSKTDQYLQEAKYFIEYRNWEIAKNLGIKSASAHSKLSRTHKALYPTPMEVNLHSIIYYIWDFKKSTLFLPKRYAHVI